MIDVDGNKDDLGTPGIRRFGFREMLSLNDRTYLVKHSQVRNIDTGEVLCQQDKLENTLFVILMGRVNIMEQVDNNKLMIGSLKTGDLVGEIGALFTLPRIASVVAAEPTVVLEISADEFTKLIRKTPKLHELVYQQLYERSLETALCSSPVMNESGPADNPDLSRMLQCWQAAKLN